MAKWQQICQEADIDCDKKFTLESSIGDFEMASALLYICVRMSVTLEAICQV